MIHRFTEDAENVITRLEDEKTPPEEEHDKQVSLIKHDLKNHFVPGFDQNIKALVPCLSVWVLHGGQKPRHRLLGDHLHLLGHPRPVHSKCKQLKRFLHISIFNSGFKLFRKMPPSSPTGSYDVFQLISISSLKIKSVGTGTLSFKLKVNLLLLVDICQICIGASALCSWNMFQRS